MRQHGKTKIVKLMYLNYAWDGMGHTSVKFIIDN